MRSPRSSALIACVVVGGALAGCSSSSGSSVATQSGPDGGVAGDTGDPEAASPEAGCPPASVCGSQCCDSFHTCTKDSEGNTSCVQTCTTSAECPTDAPCCMRVAGTGPALCMADPQVPQTCLCAKPTDCSSRACAPAVNAAGEPTGPLVCVPDDGSAYQGCVGIASCSLPYCCVTDKSGNQYCAMPCTSDSTCGPGHCESFDFSAAQGCGGDTKACGN